MQVMATGSTVSMLKEMMMSISTILMYQTSYSARLMLFLLMKMKNILNLQIIIETIGTLDSLKSLPTELVLIKRKTP